MRRLRHAAGESWCPLTNLPMFERTYLFRVRQLWCAELVAYPKHPLRSYCSMTIAIFRVVRSVKNKSPVVDSDRSKQPYNRYSGRLCKQELDVETARGFENPGAS